MSAATDPSPTLDVHRVAHVVGVGGPGMSAIAATLIGMGHTVSGSDVVESRTLDRLRSLGVTVHVGHDESNIPEDADLVAISTAIPLDNLEIVAAQRRGIPVVRRNSLLAAIASTRRTIAVAGTHGKTTTSSMLATILRGAGLDPAFLIGGEVTQLGTNAEWGTGELFVLEADESDGSGFAVEHLGAIVTNVEPDHLEFHGTTENLHAAFAAFMAATEGPLIVCADDPVASELGRTLDARSYGFSTDADVRIVDLRPSRTGSVFEVEVDGVRLGDVRLPMAGAHNATNACGAIAMALELGVDVPTASSALADFGGVGRRFEKRGECDGIVLVDDYAHLPTEVSAAISAGHDGGWDRVVAVFQPHRYSRTQSLWREFADAFVGADLLVLTGIYAAGEAPREGISGELLVDAVSSAHPDQRIIYVADRSDLAAVVADELVAGDLCLTLGAGDITALADEILPLLETRVRP